MGSASITTKNNKIPPFFFVFFLNQEKKQEYQSVSVALLECFTKMKEKASYFYFPNTTVFSSYKSSYEKKQLQCKHHQSRHNVLKNKTNAVVLHYTLWK